MISRLVIRLIHTHYVNIEELKGGDLASTWVMNLYVHAESVMDLVNPLLQLNSCRN